MLQSASRSGFTLFELLIGLAIVFVAGMIIIPSYRGYTFNSELIVARDLVVQILNQAQIHARLGEQDSNWGVHFEAGRVIEFKGGVFSVFNPATDTEFKIPASVAITGVADIVFGKITGLPNWSGVITLSNLVGQSVSLNLNGRGVVDY